jgi:hypothetical protein
MKRRIESHKEKAKRPSKPSCKHYKTDGYLLAQNLSSKIQSLLKNMQKNEEVGIERPEAYTSFLKGLKP